MPRQLHLTLCAFTFSLVAGITGCRSTPSAPRPATDGTSVPTPKIMSPAARADASKLAATHPAFKVFLQKPDLPTILTVPETTSDDQLRSLLWYLRKEVQSGHYKQLGLSPTVATYGGPSFLSGSLTIYRGPHCAPEMYLAATEKPGPCGDTSSHNAAAYHWGDDGNPRHDAGDLFDTNRKITTVFDENDGFQTEAEAQADPDGRKATAIDARIHYAIAQTAYQSRQHTDIRFFVAAPPFAPGTPDQLNAISYQFATPDARDRFTREFSTLESGHLCALGFHALALGTRISDAKPTPIPCPTSNVPGGSQ